MVTEQQFKDAIKQVEDAEKITKQYWVEKREQFTDRMKNNPIFTDEELRYSATARCLCGHGLAYPKECGPNHYWDCSAILKGIADKGVKHEGQLPFIFYDIKSESDYRGTTRPSGKPDNK